ncbi:uncharacterized protein LOC141595260 [Silene latifolia]|uniref:uncharacterized protein LOC141595260 n=1 Tax=Silene latifolia TaxID=37657 RepID=UPI003D77BEEB
MGICGDTVCCICGVQNESHTHLFFECAYSKACLGLLNGFFKMVIPTDNFMHWWLKLRLKNLLRKKIIAAGIQSLIYNIWEMRNKSRIDGMLLRPETLIGKILMDLRLRLQVLHAAGKINDSYRDWI